MYKMELKANEGKNIKIEVNGKQYERYAIKTHYVKEHENYIDIKKLLHFVKVE